MGNTLSNIAAFALYFGLGGVLIAAFAMIYMRLTAHDEVALIKGGNLAAALALGGNLAGFSIPLNKAIAQAAGVWDCLLWAAIALGVQVVIYLGARALIPDVSTRIEQNNVAVATFMAFAALVGGMLNAAAMTITPGTGG